MNDPYDIENEALIFSQEQFPDLAKATIIKTCLNCCVENEGLFFQEKETEQTELATYRHVTNPRIKLFQEKIIRLQNLQARVQIKEAQHLKKLDQLRIQAKMETDYLKIESLLTEIKTLEKVPATKDYSDQLETTKIQLSELKPLDQSKRVEGNLVVNEKNKGKREELQATRFTGFMTTLMIE